MKPYHLALLASLIVHLLLLGQIDVTREMPEVRIVKLGVQLDYSELASRRHAEQQSDKAELTENKKPQATTAATTETPASKPTEGVPEQKPAPNIAKENTLQSRESSSKQENVKLSQEPIPESDTKPEQNAASATEINESAANQPTQRQANTTLEAQAPVQIPASAPQRSEVAEAEPSAPKFELGSLNNPEPSYPALARNRGWEGDVLIGVHVNADGSVKNLEILKTSHYGPLDHAAWVTVKNEWRFEPAELEGEKVPAFVEVPISFRLRTPTSR